MAFDLDAFIAEADDEPFVFTFGGVEFTWPGTLDLRADAALAEGRLFDALRYNNGPQHEKFMAAWESHDGTLDVRAVKGLFSAHATHRGVSLGESPASSSSSASTEKRSRPTSKRTIK